MTALETVVPSPAPGVRRAAVAAVRGSTWRVFLGVIALGASAAAAESRFAPGLSTVLGVVTVAITVIGIRTYRLDHSLLWHVGRTKPWGLLACGLGGIVVANGGRTVLSGGRFPSPFDLIALPAYLCVAVGALMLIRGRAPGHTADSLVTSGIVVLAVGFPVWTIVFESRIHAGLDTSTAVAALALPMLDLFALTLVARLMLLSEEHPPVYSYLLLGLGTLMAVHCIAAIGVLHGIDRPYRTLDGPLVLAYGLWAAAALHPSMGGLFEPVGRRAPRLGTTQLAALAGALLLGPAVLAVQMSRGIRGTELSIIVGSAIMAALVIARLARFVQARAEVEQAASHDELTSLPRRELFNERVAVAVAAAYQRAGRMAVMFIDVDRFKKINDSLGHAIGDEVIDLVGRRLRNCVRHDDMVARMGGDEFTVLLEDLASEADATAVARNIVEAFVEPLHVAGRQLFVTASVGVAAYPRDGSDAETLLKNADAAMYLAKEKGRNNFQAYTSELNSRAEEWLDLENALHSAITHGELVVHYQPKIALESGRVAGVEALVRWQHPQLGLLGPDKFIPVAEESGLIGPLGEWVLEAACRQAVGWRDEGYKNLSVAVNLSARQFQLQAMDDVVAAVLRRTGLPPRLLELELTESLALQGSESIRKTLEGISSLGVKCAVDDFGVGFSNFGYLGTLPIDKVKVDKSFVRQIGVSDDRSSSALAVGVIALAKALGLEVVAEGVETHEQLEFLHEHGCDQIQGYLFSAPLPAEQLSSLLMLEVVSPGAGRLGQVKPAPTPPQPATTGERRRTTAGTAPLTAAVRARRSRPLRAR